MILFLDDYRRYPNAIIDVNTSNQSFVRLASVYREMGVVNHAFILSLINPALQGVDPFSTELTLEQMTAVAVECAMNPWYFLREVARAPGKGTPIANPVEANRGNIAFYWCFFNHVMSMLIQIRQTGKTFTFQTLVTLLMNIVCKYTQINLLTKDDILRRETIKNLKEVAEELPPYLRQNTKDDANNGEELTVKNLNNTFLTHLPQMSEKRAYLAGRGLTSPIFFGDEVPFQTNISIMLPSALGATGAAIDAAKKAGTPYGVALMTTAGKKDDKDGAYVYGLLNDSAYWTEKFFDCKDEEELHNVIKRNSRGNVVRVNITLNHRQLGKTDEWLKEKLDTSTQSGDDANRDFFNKWTSGNATNPLSTAILERIVASKVDDPHITMSNPHGYIIRWYIAEHNVERRMKECKTAIGLDTSEASGGDSISLVITDIETLETIGAGTFNETNLIMFAEWLVSLIIQWPNSTWIIERRSTGGAIIDYLLLMLMAKGIDPFERLYNRIVHEYDEYPNRFREIKVPLNRRPGDLCTRYKSTFGFATSGSGYASRSELYSTTLQNAAKRSADNVKDCVLIEQISSLITKNGRVDHPPGEHDDMVIGWLLTHWLITQGKNLSFYGIDSRMVMSAVKDTTSVFNNVDYEFRNKQQAIREKMDELYTKLINEKDEFVSMRIEHDLRLLDKQIVLDNNEEIYSLDALINKAKEEKINKRRYRSNNIQETSMIGIGYNPTMNNAVGTFSDRPLSINEIKW